MEVVLVRLQVTFPFWWKEALEDGDDHILAIIPMKPDYQVPAFGRSRCYIYMSNQRAFSSRTHLQQYTKVLMLWIG